MKSLRTIKKIAMWLSIVATAIVGIGGFLHTSYGRPLLARLGVGCPGRAGTPEEVDRARSLGAAHYARRNEAPDRPALVFALEATSFSDWEAWVNRHALDCDRIRGTETLRRCKNVSAEALGQPAWFGPSEEVTFSFRANRRLASISTMRRKLPVDRANAMTAELGRRLHASLGEPQMKGGRNDPAHFEKGSLQAYKEEWAFRDYGATLTEVRLADTGIMVREHYIAPNDGVGTGRGGLQNDGSRAAR